MTILFRLIGLLLLVQLTLLLLKLNLVAPVATWAWAWVWAPAWGTWLLTAVGALLVLIWRHFKLRTPWA